jgi:hypothetical protein
MNPLSRSLIAMLLVACGAVSARADDKADVLAANTQVEQAFSKLDVKATEATWARTGLFPSYTPQVKYRSWVGRPSKKVMRTIRFGTRTSLL